MSDNGWVLILVSDLHLADRRSRSTIDDEYFSRMIRDTLRVAADDGVRGVRIVLLGDTFEGLKSDSWISDGVRPWWSARRDATAHKILDKILDANGAVLTSLRQATSEFGAVIEYLPGNHDFVFNATEGCRAKIRTALGAGATDDRRFKEIFIDKQHRVLAAHGHRHDSANRYKPSNPIGDAIVIEILVRLPIQIAESLEIDVNDPTLDFVHEIDNVVPQDPPAMARWLLAGLAALPKAYRPALRKGLAAVAAEIAVVMDRVPFEQSALGSWWVQILSFAAKRLLPHVDPLSIFSKVPAFPARPSYSHFAKIHAEEAAVKGLKPAYVVYGHTHVAEVKPIAMTYGTALYLNTGTWRRGVINAPFAPPGLPAFAAESIQTLAVIRSPAEVRPGSPAYELRTIKSGT